MIFTHFIRPATFYPRPGTFYPRPGTFFPRPATFFPRPASQTPAAYCQMTPTGYTKNLRNLLSQSKQFRHKPRRLMTLDLLNNKNIKQTPNDSTLSFRDVQAYRICDNLRFGFYYKNNVEPNKTWNLIDLLRISSRKLMPEFRRLYSQASG